MEMERKSTQQKIDLQKIDLDTLYKQMGITVDEYETALDGLKEIMRLLPCHDPMLERKRRKKNE